MLDERTTHLNLPLPHPDNLLSQDVARLRQALIAMDAAYHSQHQDVQQQLAATITTVAASLDATTTELTRQLRRVRLMNQLLGLNI